MNRGKQAASVEYASSGLVLPSIAEAKQWETEAPHAFQRLLDEICADEKHRRRMDWAELGARVFGQVCAFGTVVVLALLARHFVDRGASTQGAAIIGTGAVSIVAVFVTGRLVNRDSTKPEDPK